jgi:RNA polymerase sigma-70 factor (ECF subfamily)
MTTDAADFADLYFEFADRIRRYIYRRTGDGALSEDLTAETFCKALDALQRGNGYHSSLSGWLFRIARNLVIDHYRKRERAFVGSLDSMFSRSQVRVSVSERGSGNSTVELGDYLPDSSDLETETVDRLWLVDFIAGIERILPASQTTVLQLRYFEGYGFDEIAAALDTTEGAVKATQHRAIARLRERMAA